AGFDRLLLCEQRLGVASLSDDRAWFIPSLLEGCVDCGGIELRGCALVPLNRYIVERRARDPVVIGDHSDAFADVDDLPHSGPFERSGAVERRAPATQYGAGSEHRVHHPGLLDVDTEYRAAARLIRAVEALERLADHRKLARRLQRQVLGNWLVRSRRSEF